MKQQVNILISEGGLGDLICSLVAVNYNINNYTNVEFLVWVPDYLYKLSKHLLPQGIIVRPFSKTKNKYNDTLPGVTTKWGKSFHTPMRTHPVDYAFHMLADKHLYNFNEKNYLQINASKINLKRFKLPEKYVVISATAVEKVKTMVPKTMNKIIDYSLYKGYTPVFLGKTVTDVGIDNLSIKANINALDFSKGLNLIDKTNLLESGAIISGAKCIIGMDGGLIHLAGCTPVPIICGYTFASPDHLMPIRNGLMGYNVYPIVPDESKCRFCQTNANFTFKQDFRDCIYKKDYECVKSLDVNKFLEAMDKVL